VFVWRWECYLPPALDDAHTPHTAPRLAAHAAHQHLNASAAGFETHATHLPTSSGVGIPAQLLHSSGAEYCHKPSCSHVLPPTTTVFGRSDGYVSQEDPLNHVSGRHLVGADLAMQPRQALC